MKRMPLYATTTACWPAGSRTAAGRHEQRFAAALGDDGIVGASSTSVGAPVSDCQRLAASASLSLLSATLRLRPASAVGWLYLWLPTLTLLLAGALVSLLFAALAAHVARETWRCCCG